MTAQTLKLLPDVVHVEIYAGDDSSFTLTAVLDDEARDVSGTHLAQVKLNRGEDAVGEITVEPTGEDGECTFTIPKDVADAILDAGDETEISAYGSGVIATIKRFYGEWDWQHTDAEDQTVTYATGRFIVDADVSRPVG